MSKIIKCPKCHADFKWDSTAEIVECPQCKTRYRLHAKKPVQPVLMPPVGRGAVDYITVPNESVIRNRPLLKCYIPKGWHYQCALVGDRFDMIGNPFVVSVSFLAPDDSAKIVFTGESFYKHVDLTPQTYNLQNRLDDFTVSRSPSFFRLKTAMSSEEYCDALAESCGLDRLTLIHEKEPDEEETTNQRQAVQRFLSQGFVDANVGWSARTYRGSSGNGQQFRVYSETRVIQLMKISVVQTLQLTRMPGMFGMRTVPQMVNQQRQDIFWETPYEFTLLAVDGAFERSLEELEKMKKTIDYLPGMEQARADAMALVNNAQMSMAQTQAQSFENQQRIIADKNAHIDNIQQQMIAGNAATHNKVSNMQSEMINEVNVYKGSEGFVQASTSFDHVYQNRQYPDVYAAQVGSGYDFGVDFEELEKSDGDY